MHLEARTPCQHNTTFVYSKFTLFVDKASRTPGSRGFVGCEYAVPTLTSAGTFAAADAGAGDGPHYYQWFAPTVTGIRKSKRCTACMEHCGTQEHMWPVLIDGSRTLDAWGVWKGSLPAVAGSDP